MPELPGDPQRAALGSPFVLALLRAGIDPGKLRVGPDGGYRLERRNGDCIFFGPSELPEGQKADPEALAEGWDYCAYGANGPPQVQDWVKTDEEMITVLTRWAEA